MSSPSPKAIDAANAVDDMDVSEALSAAHDPALGLDRSVCLRDVIEALEGRGYRDIIGHDASDYIAVTLGGEPEPANWAELETL